MVGGKLVAHPRAPCVQDTHTLSLTHTRCLSLTLSHTHTHSHAGCPWMADGNCSTVDYPTSGTSGVFSLSLMVPRKAPRGGILTPLLEPLSRFCRKLPPNVDAPAVNQLLENKSPSPSWYPSARTQNPGTRNPEHGKRNPKF